MNWSRRWCPLSLAVGALGSVAILLVFKPANISRNSISQCEQAIRGMYSDLYPLATAFRLALLIIATLAYYSSYFLAVAVPDFRFMNPGMVLIRLVMFTILGFGTSRIFMTK